MSLRDARQTINDVTGLVGAVGNLFRQADRTRDAVEGTLNGSSSGNITNNQQLQQALRTHEQFLTQVQRSGELRIRSSLGNNSEAQRQFQAAYSEFRLAYFDALGGNYNSTPNQQRLFAAQQKLERDILTIVSSEYRTSSSGNQPTATQPSVFDSRRAPQQPVIPNPAYPTITQPQLPSSSVTPVPSSQSPSNQALSDSIPRRDLYRFFSKMESYAGRNGEAGRTTDLRNDLRTAWNQVRGRGGDIPVQELGNLIPQQLVEQTRTSLGFRISRTLGAPQLSSIPDTILSAGNAQLPAGSAVNPASILQLIDGGAERIARLAPAGGSAAGQTIKVLSVFYGLAAARLLATNGANQGTQARIERMLEATLRATNQIRSPLASADVTGADSSSALASTTTTSELTALTAPQSVTVTPDASSQSQDSVIPAQPVAVMPESSSVTTPRTEPTSPQVREVSTGDTGAYQQLAQEIQQGNFNRARTYISAIAQRANVNPDELLEIMRTKVNGGREGSELLRAISVDQLAGSLAAIIHPGAAATGTEAVQVAALRAFRNGGAEGTLLSARANNRTETIAQALTAPELPQASTVVAAVPALETTIVPTQQSTEDRSEREEEQDPTSRRRRTSTPNTPGLEDLPDSVQRRVVQV